MLEVSNDLSERDLKKRILDTVRIREKAMTEFLNVVRIREKAMTELTELKYEVKMCGKRIKDLNKQISDSDAILAALQLKANPHGLNVEVKGSFGS